MSNGICSLIFLYLCYSTSFSVLTVFSFNIQEKVNEKQNKEAKSTKIQYQNNLEFSKVDLQYDEIDIVVFGGVEKRPLNDKYVKSKINEIFITKEKLC